MIAAPIGGVSFNMGGGVSEESYAQAIISGCKAKGTIGCSGDGVPEFIYQAGFAAIAEEDGHGIPFLKPWEDEEFYRKLSEAKEMGTRIIGMDIDAAGLITLRKMGRPVSPKSFAKLTEIIKNVGLKFILKGVMTRMRPSLLPKPALMRLWCQITGAECWTMHQVQQRC